MDRIIELYERRDDSGLAICDGYGIAYQLDQSIKIDYGGKYFEAYKSRTDTDTARRIMASRISMMAKYIKRNDRVLEIGVGSGEFIEKAPFRVDGYDINPKAKEWLKNVGKFFDMDAPIVGSKDVGLRDYDAVCLWDVIEHFETPEHLFKKIPQDSLVFISVPIMVDILKTKASKHYKPGEHFYYWTLPAFVDWMYDWGFSLLEIGDGEIQAGRDYVYSFVFKKDLPDYHGLIEQYSQIHNAGSYGTTSGEFLQDIGRIVAKENPKSILDFGAGQSDLVAHFYADGKRKIERYDPSIPKFKTVGGVFDLVLCNDVLEHLWKRDLIRVLNEIKDRSDKVIFSVSTKPARKLLPCGLNAHVTVMPERFWAHVIKGVFGNCHKIRDYGAGFLCRTF